VWIRFLNGIVRILLSLFVLKPIRLEVVALASPVVPMMPERRSGVTPFVTAYFEGV
jgi:hypothetical protein